jgi:hypothetical protein
MVQFPKTIAGVMATTHHGDTIGGYTTALAVEIPLLVLAVTTVALRVFSRLVIKRKLAADDILIILGTVCQILGPKQIRSDVVDDSQGAAIARTVISCMSAEDNWGYDRKG